MRAADASAKRGVRGTRSPKATNGNTNKVDDVSRSASAAQLREFRSTVWEYWKKNGRHDLPWRKTKDPYRILVSEVMLQQTQVPRVIEKYKEFLMKFPTVRALSQASLADVLKVWSGLGYNRRGKYLHDAAKEIVGKYGGKVPQDLAAVLTLPGVGAYTASAVRAFAFNKPDVLIETNIRAAFIHHFSPHKYRGRSSINSARTVLDKVRDAEIVPVAQKAAEGQDPREWHWALMDYGVHIKKLHKNPARRSAHYAKQSKFEGSLRQIRGAILRALQRGPSSLKDVPFDGVRIETALASLARDGLIVKEKGKWRIA